MPPAKQSIDFKKAALSCPYPGRLYVALLAQTGEDDRARDKPMSGIGKAASIPAPTALASGAPILIGGTTVRSISDWPGGLGRKHQGTTAKWPRRGGRGHEVVEGRPAARWKFRSRIVLR
jgi:hypothetical protein